MYKAKICKKRMNKKFIYARLSNKLVFVQIKMVRSTKAKRAEPKSHNVDVGCQNHIEYPIEWFPLMPIWCRRDRKWYAGRHLIISFATLSALSVFSRPSFMEMMQSWMKWCKMLICVMNIYKNSKTCNKDSNPWPLQR